MASQKEQRPLVLIAQPRTQNPVYFNSIRRALHDDGKDCKVVASVRELIEHLRFPQCFCAFISSDFAPDVVSIIRAARQVSSVEWFLIAPADARNLSYRAVEAGAKGVLDEALTPYQYVQRARQVLASVQGDDRDKKTHKDVRLTGVSSKEPQVFVPRSKQNPLEGIEVLMGAKDYRLRRPEWELIAQTQKVREFKGLEDLRTQCELDLLDLIQSEPRASMSLISLKVRDPLVEMPPMDIRSLASSNLLEDRSIHSALEYPDILSALELSRAVVVRDVEVSPKFSELSFDLVSRGIRSRAAIPLYLGGKIVGMMKVQFAEPMNPRIQNLLDDLVPFSSNFISAFSKMDFLNRVYEAANL